MHHLLLGVNIDHIATLRQARGTHYPNPVFAALLAEQAGANLITLHRREDERHINANDVHLIKSVIQIPMNLESSIDEEALSFLESVRPEKACLVPERREELTTEGGLDLIAHEKRVHHAVQRLQDLGILVSLFIDPLPLQIDLALATGAEAIELHTGAYADAKDQIQLEAELKRIQKAAVYAKSQGLVVNAGHGLNYQNIRAIAAIEALSELNIGHAIVAEAVFCGLGAAIEKMRALIAVSRLDFEKTAN